MSFALVTRTSTTVARASVILVAVALLALAAVGCGSADGAETASVGSATNHVTSTTQRSTKIRTTAGTGGDRIVVIGDSITNEGRTELAAMLGVDHRVVIDGHPGYLIALQQPVAIELAATNPSIVVIELGTNDVAFGHPVDVSIVDMERMVSTFLGARCIVLTTVSTGFPNGDEVARARVLDAAYRAIADRDPRVRIVDFDAVIDAANSDPSFIGPFFYDGIHPTASGQERLARATADAVASCGS